MTIESNAKQRALVFGASGEQGRAVVEGLACAGYSPVYAFGHQHTVDQQQYLTDALGAIFWKGDLQNVEDVRQVLLESQATAIVLITTTDIPCDGFSTAAADEYQVIESFFRCLKEVYNKDKIPRHIVFSCRDNVQEEAKEWIDPLDDGSIVPHFSAKGRGAAFALQFLADTPELKLTLVTIPLLYSNFLGFFCPLPDESQTQWTLAACFGNGDNKIDMLGTQDLSVLVPNILDEPEKYDRKNLRVVSQRISMDEIASIFEDLYGKPVIYNPLTVEEVSSMAFEGAAAVAQMCQYLGDARHRPHDEDLTRQILGKVPQQFEDWLLTHSEAFAFVKAGLTEDAPSIVSVAVFGAPSLEATSVVKGLLADSRKEYAIRIPVSDVNNQDVVELKALHPDRITAVLVDLKDTASCQAAVDGVQGVFLVTHGLSDESTSCKQEEEQICRLIDACEVAKSVRHLVFSTLESAELLSHMQELGHFEHTSAENHFDARARSAAYARTKKLSVTYVLLPYYTEHFLSMMQKQSDSSLVLNVPKEKQDTKVVCMSIEDLGVAVANIFDSYQVYSGHEIGLVTDFASANDIKVLMEQMINSSSNGATIKEEKVPHPTYMKDFGQMFGNLAHSEAVKRRRSVAKTFQLIPSARPLKDWIERNGNDESFREKLGLR